ncbi:D-glycero-beta-D-manno-heptose-7-phosphate kinase [Candidatus Saganbacteria bacterium]|nr:D-glycero-beta-D-manno-heptose-7-phosphate kinase [Candidatus Saganbacteria bacterium]
MIETILKKILPNFSGKKILIVGDIMLDEHIWSKVNRISPEAPVVIADVTRISHVPGGCGNVAANIKALGGTPLLVGLVGNDSSGDKLLVSLNNCGIQTNLIIKTGGRPTILKSRVIAGSQQVVRVDREDKGPLPVNLSEKVLKAALKQIKNADAVIISDYGKGITSEHLCQSMIKAAKQNKIPVLVDPKGTNYSKYKGATIITPNLSEASVASKVKIDDEKTLSKAGNFLLKTLDLQYALITKSENGMSLFAKNGQVINIPGIKREVFDITGAGDTVIATIALSLASGAKIEEACHLSNIAGSVKVTKIATQPVHANELEAALEEKEPTSRKIKTRKEISEIAKRLKSEGARIAFTNGCFDILHLGHVRYLKEAKKLGDVLIVGLNSDRSVKSLKGSTRPYVSGLERAEILASLESVDYVVIFDESRPDNLIRSIGPNVHVKGGDYKISQLPERKLVEQLGGKVVVIPPTKGRSTSNIIDRILGRQQ